MGSTTEWFGSAGGEAVELRRYTGDWALAGASWAARIQRALDPLAARVDHIGSTSIPGMPAKPVIDLQVQVPELSRESDYLPSLTALGLVLRARDEEFRFFRPPAGEPRVVHVHVCAIDSEWALHHLCFRDALRGDQQLARRYADLKAALAREVGHDRGAYNRGKSAFILDVVEARRGR